MKHLYYARHGLSEFNMQYIWAGTSNTPLSEKGRKQMTEVGKSLVKQQIQIDLIIASPLSRTKESSEIIANEIGYELDKIDYDPQIIERSFGVLEGTKNMAAGEMYLNNEADIEIFEGVEKLTELKKRTDAFWRKIQKIEDDSILIVGHGAFYRCLVRSINSLPVSSKIEPTPQGSFSKLV